MALSLRHVDILIDVLENKLSDMLIWDGEDRKEITILKSCLEELNVIKGGDFSVLPFDGRHRPGATAA